MRVSVEVAVSIISIALLIASVFFLVEFQKTPSFPPEGFRECHRIESHPLGYSVDLGNSDVIIIEREPNDSRQTEAFTFWLGDVFIRSFRDVNTSALILSDLEQGRYGTIQANTFYDANLEPVGSFRTARSLNTDYNIYDMKGEVVVFLKHMGIRSGYIVYCSEEYNGVLYNEAFVYALTSHTLQAQEEENVR